MSRPPKPPCYRADHPLSHYFRVFRGPVRSRFKAWLMTLLFVGLLYGTCVAGCMAFGYAPYVLLRYLDAPNPLPPENWLPLEQAVSVYFYLLIAFALVILPAKARKIRQWVFDYIEFPIETKLKLLTPDNPRIVAVLNDLQTTLTAIGQLDWPYQRYTPSQEIPPYMDTIGRVQQSLIRLQHGVRQQHATGLPDPTLTTQWNSIKATLGELPRELGEIMADRLSYHYKRVANILALISLPLSVVVLGVLGVVLSVGTLVGALTNDLVEGGNKTDRSYRIPRELR